MSTDIKIVPPTFTGKSDPEAYMDWEKRLEYIFECYGYGEHKKVALAAAQLTENALAWWDRNVAERRRNRFGAATTWADMKYLLRLRYVPDYYHRDLQKRFRKLSQGNRSVEEYFEEFEKLMNSLELEESEEALMAQFIDGLQERISRKVERAQYSGLHELMHLAVQVEKQIKRKTVTSRSRNSQPWTSNVNKPNDKGKAVEIDSRFKGKGDDSNKGPRQDQNKGTNNQRARDVTCFRCQGRGHMARECPNQRVMTITTNGDYESQDESEMEAMNSGEEVEYPDTGEMLVTRRVLNGGSCTNVASKYMVDRLGLETTKHPRPYRLQWLDNKTELKVTEQAKISFSIGKYQDEVVCDMVPMQAGHILLGRPWQFDRATFHNGRTNYYSFKFKDRKYNLAPLSPSEVHELQTKMNKEDQ
ncbi:uncharacterized protein LOC130507746, partial [Raphanus sativus]|uniref:Uncharacterized protein LOC130507746 n=1 Tax=Raphanus sativus TaxID=3726 RepID=A0A9W3D372_RAPSA